VFTVLLELPRDLKRMTRGEKLAFFKIGRAGTVLFLEIVPRYSCIELGNELRPLDRNEDLGYTEYLPT